MHNRPHRPSGSSDAAIHVILPWSPAFGKDHHMPDSVLVSELSTSRKLIEKGLNANITKVSLRMCHSGYIV